MSTVKKPSLENLGQSLADEAQKWLWVRETAPNRGETVDRFCRALNESISHAWCGAFVAFCIKEIEARHSAKSGLTLSEHVLTMWNLNPLHRVSFPEVGAIAIWRRKGTISGHCGIVTEVDPKGEKFETIEGNTSAARGVDRDGDGVFKKPNNMTGNGQFRLLGFLRPF